MSSTLSQWPKGQILRWITEAGAVGAGCARACDISDGADAQFALWLSRGDHGAMDWISRHRLLRLNPERVLPGARTVICAAFPYAPAGGWKHPQIADYALGMDYHVAIRRRLQPVAERITAQFGAMARVCIDTAPLPERYWATMCGIGRPGRSGQLIVPGVGAGVFIATSLTTLELSADSPLRDFDPCGDCRRCIDACPGRAIRSDGTLDCRRCLSYLTIEHRGEWPENAPRRGARVYGCDICRRVCPHSAGAVRALEEFEPREELMGIDFAQLSAGDWRRLTRSKTMPSAMSRLPFGQLRVTLRNK